MELLTNGPLASSIRTALIDGAGVLIAPHLLDIEVMSALRRVAAGETAGPVQALNLTANLASFPAERMDHAPLLPRIWELRKNFTAYDAAYIALAEALDAVLFTCDTKLARGHRAEVIVLHD